MHWIDPESVSESKHRVRLFLVDAHGEVDGFVSTEGQQIHVPPHMGRALTASINIGDMVYVRGVKPRQADVLVALSIESAHGERIEDHGPTAKPHAKPSKKKAQKREMEGVTERVLFAPKGERVGVLLTNGVSVRFDPAAADDLNDFLAPEQHLAVSGELRSTKWGTVLDADYFWHPESPKAP